MTAQTVRGSPRKSSKMNTCARPRHGVGTSICRVSSGSSGCQRSAGACDLRGAGPCCGFGVVCEGPQSLQCPGTWGHHRHFANAAQRRQGMFILKAVHILWGTYFHAQIGMPAGQLTPTAALPSHTGITCTAHPHSALCHILCLRMEESHTVGKAAGKQPGSAPVRCCLLLTLGWTVWLPY